MALSGKDYYYYYKSRGICVRCGAMDAAPRRVYCMDCLDKAAERARQRREKQNAEQKKAELAECSVRKKALYEARKAAGLCPMCGKQKRNSAYVQCDACRRRERRNQARLRHKKGGEIHDMRIGADVCFFCKSPSMPGKRVCGECYQRVCGYLQDAHKKVDWYHHPWRKGK